MKASHRRVPKPDNGRPSGTAANRRTLVAVDLGAESCRVSLLRWVDDQPQILAVSRFPNGPIQESTGLHWDIRKILRGIEEGLRACAELAPEGIASIGVDGWAVDYVRIGTDGGPVSNPFCYRDERTIEAQRQVHARIAAERLYALTGVQILALNSLYQLYADSQRSLDQRIRWLNLPEFVLHHLGGRPVAEYTNASHTALLSVNERHWCREIFDAAGLDLNAAPPVVTPGTEVGRLQGPLAELPPFRDTKLIVPACHDTASAIAGMPTRGDDIAFISSGTWSLVGAVLDAPCLSEAARSKNFSNEGGVGGRINFLKIINGMWLLQQCIEHWRSQGRIWSVEEIVKACRSLPRPECLLDVDDPDLVLPGNMPQRINAQLVRQDKAPIADGAEAAPHMANLIFHSLAARYAAVLRDLVSITGKRLRRICIVGGGSKNTFLNA
ncbi:MAG TPA: FGGY family carbohydrate kinase, partial [Terriglobales bacterium]